MATNRRPVPEKELVKTTVMPRTSITLTTQVSSFSLLPNDIMNLFFYYYLNGKDSFNLRQTSKKIYDLFKPTIWQFADHPLRKLLSHGALGELEQAEPYYTQDKSILNLYGTVYHPNRIYNDKVNPPVWKTIPEEISFGRYKYVKVTYLQILMMNDEWQEATEVAKHMDKDEVVKQFFEVFPEGKIIKYDNEGKAWDFEKAKRLLEALFNAILKDKIINVKDPNHMSNETRQAWKEFFDYHKPNPKGHSKGLIFDPRIVEIALRLYDKEYYNGKSRFNDGQRSFWNKRVEEALKSLLGTGFLRPCSQGYYNDIKRKGCFLADSSSYFSFRRSSNYLLPGFHFWVTGSGSAAADSRTWGTGVIVFEDLHKKIAQSRLDFMQQYPSTRNTHNCVIS